MAIISSPPLLSSVIENDEKIPARRDPFYMAKAWILWIQDALVPRIQACPQVLSTVKILTGQVASIGATALPLGLLSAGIYRISIYGRVTTAAGVNSSLTLTVGFTEGGVPVTISGAANVSNSINSAQGFVFQVPIDRSTAITYATTYASAGAPVMAYEIQVLAERVQ